MEHHVSWAHANGVDDQDVVMAMEIGKATRKGAAERIDQFISARFKGG